MNKIYTRSELIALTQVQLRALVRELGLGDGTYLLRNASGRHHRHACSADRMRNEIWNHQARSAS